MTQFTLYGFDSAGGFVVILPDTLEFAYAYPSSAHCLAGRRDGLGTARIMRDGIVRDRWIILSPGREKSRREQCVHLMAEIGVRASEVA